MKAALLGQTEVREHLKMRFRSGDYWIIVPDVQANQAVEELEEKFYTGEAARDFEAILLPLPGMIGLYLAHKRRLSVKKLQAFLCEFSPLKFSKADLRDHDVLLLFADRQQAEQAASALHDWLFLNPQLN